MGEKIAFITFCVLQSIKVFSYYFDTIEARKLGFDSIFHFQMENRSICNAVFPDIALRLKKFNRKEMLFLQFSLTLIIAIPLLVTLLGSAVFQLLLTVFPIFSLNVPYQIISILCIIIVILIIIIYNFLTTK